MKIAVSVLGNVAINDGTTVRAKRIFKVLSREFDTTLITRGNTTVNDKRVIIIRPSTTRLWNLKLIPIILKMKFDIVYCSNDFLGFVTYFFLSRILGFGIIMEAHGAISVEFEKARNRNLVNKIYTAFLRHLEEFAISHAGYVIALSRDVFEFYSRFNSRIEIIPVFVDGVTERALPKRGEKGERRVIGLIGPFVKNSINTHALKFFLDNLEELTEEAEAVIIGNCDEEYKVQNKRLKYTGYIPSEEDYLDQLSKLDIVVVPGRFPTYGPLTKILEPMSLGIPVLTTPTGAIGLDYVKDGRDILIAEESLVIRRLNETLRDKELLKTIGRNARRTVIQHYSRENYERRLLEITELMNGKAVSPDEFGLTVDGTRIH